MSAPQTLYDQARFPAWARLVCILLALACAWVTIHLFGSWVTGPHFFPHAAPRATDYGWPAPLAAAALSFFFLQISSGRSVLIYDAGRERIIVEQRWLIGSRRRVYPAPNVQSVALRASQAGRWSLLLERPESAADVLLTGSKEAPMRRAAARLAELLECELEN